MKVLTKAFMKGRFDSFAFSASRAQELFESYLSMQNDHEREVEKEKLLTVLKEANTTYVRLMETLSQALEEGD